MTALRLTWVHLGGAPLRREAGAPLRREAGAPRRLEAGPCRQKSGAEDGDHCLNGVRGGLRIPTGDREDRCRAGGVIPTTG
ncbi:hypothetical protein F2P81_020667 [Scophthalmus maximus]|uniref:Uncharacterized protein n=1 Tax=Scophthalmus maximus TaxID=52904 RepID=A0A6A4RYI2_SCOMX|nr:hypothetical protein F2P81_020667 [Scophthalmus maximus]